jgi:hypothetical protein
MALTHFFVLSFLSKMRSVIHYFLAQRSLFNLLIFILQEPVSSSGSTHCFIGRIRLSLQDSCTNLSYSMFLSHRHAVLHRIVVLVQQR